MNMQNQDWLDERIAVQNYIPDDGFTARVVSRLPQARADAVAILRSRILFLSAFLAFCLLLVQIIPLAQGLQHLASRYSPADFIGQLAALVQQPAVLYGGAGCVILLGFASIPFLRRWV